MQVQREPPNIISNWPDRLYFRIREVAQIVGVRPSVLRYWQTEFSGIRPKKSSAGHRVYTKTDVETALLIKQLLYEERYSIEGAKKRIVYLKSQKNIVNEAPPAHSPQETSSGSSVERYQELKALALKLQTSSQLPIEQFFRF